MALLNHVTDVLLDYKFWLLASITYLLYRHLTGKRYNLPPRPMSYPIIGNVYHVFLAKEGLYRWCKRMVKEVGPVFRISLGPIDAVVLNDYQSTHKALVERGNDFSGRMKSTILEIFTDGYQDVAFASADQPTFKARRKLLATALKNFTVGREYEDRVSESLFQLFSHFDQLAEKKESFDPTDYCKLLSYNVTASMCFQKGYAFDDPEFQNLHKMFQESNDAFSSGVTITDILPGARYLPFEFWDAKMARRIKNELLSIIYREIETSKQREQETGIVENLTMFVLKTKAEGVKEGLTDVTDLEICHIVADVFGAGVDTTQMTLRWIVLCMAVYQDIQEKVFQEIQQALPGNSTGHMVSGIDYKSRMPYSEAVLLEATRFGTVAVLGLPHATLCDTKIDDYDIPKGTPVFINHWAINHDERDFEKPDEFIPERFLDEAGKVGPRPRGYLPFGLGRRSCPGETAARNTLWITYVSLLQRFRILPPEGVQLKADYKDTTNAFEGTPVDYQIVLERR